MKTQFFWIFIVGLFSLAGSCDHTDLRGKISPSPVNASIGDTILLTLSVPDDLEGIHNELWSVIPENLGNIIFDALQGTETKKVREATFIAKENGEGVIEVHGIYKQTNYQHITETKVLVACK
jgi:hypothetical protein